MFIDISPYHECHYDIMPLDTSLEAMSSKAVFSGMAKYYEILPNASNFETWQINFRLNLPLWRIKKVEGPNTVKLIQKTWTLMMMFTS